MSTEQSSLGRKWVRSFNTSFCLQGWERKQIWITVFYHELKVSMYATAYTFFKRDFIQLSFNCPSVWKTKTSLYHSTSRTGESSFYLLRTLIRQNHIISWQWAAPVAAAVMTCTVIFSPVFHVQIPSMRIPGHQNCSNPDSAVILRKMNHQKGSNGEGMWKVVHIANLLLGIENTRYYHSRTVFKLVDRAHRTQPSQIKGDNTREKKTTFMSQYQMRRNLRTLMSAVNYILFVPSESDLNP